MKDSPPSKYILLRGEGEDKLIVRTRPFYPMFFWTEPRADNRLTTELRDKLRSSGQRNLSKDKSASCNKVIGGNVPVVSVIDDIPFGIASKNTLLLAVVVLAAVMTGVLAFHYWVEVMGGTAAAFNPVLEKRAVYLSVFFVAAAALLSVVLLELFTLKREFRPEKPHAFLFGGRRLVIWVFLLVWFGIVIYTTAVLARRPREFREQIVVNLVAGIVLLVSQYFYQQSQSPVIKTFSLSASVLVVGLLVIIVYTG